MMGGVGGVTIVGGLGLAGGVLITVVLPVDADPLEEEPVELPCPPC